MDTWLRRLRGSLGMGLTWGIAGAILGGLMEVFVDPNGAIADIWPAVLGLPAFVCGSGFSLVLAIAGRSRRFDELSLGRFALWGAMGGFAVGMIPAAMHTLGVITLSGPGENLALTTLITSGSLAVMSAAAAAGTLKLARMSEDHALMESSEEIAEVGLTREESRELLGSGV